MPENSRSRKPFEFGNLVGPAYLIVILAALSWAKEFLLPIILAMLISFLLTPVVSRLERLGFHSVLATLSVVAIAFVFIGALGATLAVEALNLVDSIPKYRSNISARWTAIQHGPPGPLNEAFRNIGDLTKDLGKTTPNFGGAPQSEPTKVQIVSGADNLVTLVKNSMTPVIGQVAEFAVVLVLVVFFLLERKQLRSRFLRLIGHSRMATTTLAVDEAGSRLSRFLLMQLAVNSVYALVLGIGLYLIGIPNAILWAVLTLVLRFLPYVGLWISAFFPLILSIAISTSWTPPILTLLLYVVLEVFTNNVVEPVVLGGSTGISPLAVIISALFWTWLWGPIGLVLATPVTACLVTLGRYFSALHPYSVMLATDPPTLSEARLVRLLTENRLPEAKAFIHELTAMRLSVETADELIVPAVRTIENELFPSSSAHLSRSAAYLSDLDVANQKKTRIYEQIRELIEELTVLRPGKSLKPAKPLRLSLPGCVIVPFVGEADEVVGRLLARLLESEGIDASLLSWRTLRAKKVQRLKELGAQFILLSTVDSKSVTSIGRMVESIKTVLPDAVIMIGLWSLPPKGAARLIRKIQASEEGDVHTNLGEAVRGFVSFATMGREETAKPSDRLDSGFSESIKLRRKATSEASVKIIDLVKTYLDNRGSPTFTAVNNINLYVKNGEFMVLVGPSGCGKSTTLRLIAGLERVTSGTILIGGQVVNHLEPKDRGIAMVFQTYALYPHMNIFENMAYTLKRTKQSKEFISAMVGETAKALQLDQMMHRNPHTLSGGQRQRVALARAIVRDPKVFLFDEPLSSLDAKMRVQMRSEISRLHGELGATTIYVTHDQVEAMTMGSRICVMRDGVIMQVADPLALYQKPENLFVAGFIGSPPMNLLKGKVQQRDGGLNFVENGEKDALTVPLKSPLQASASKYVDKEIVFGIRPENISNKPKDGSGTQVTLTVEISEPMGPESLVYLKSGTGYLIARIPGEDRFRTNEQMTVELNLDKVILFDPETEQVIP